MTATGFAGQTSVLALLTGSADGQMANGRPTGAPDQPSMTAMPPRSSGFAHHLAALAPDIVNGAGREQGAIDEYPHGPIVSATLAPSAWGAAEKHVLQGEPRATSVPDDASQGPLPRDLPGLDRAQDRVPRNRGDAWTRLGKIVARLADGVEHPPPSASHTPPSEPLELPPHSAVSDAPSPNATPSPPQIAFPTQTIDGAPVLAPEADPQSGDTSRGATRNAAAPGVQIAAPPALSDLPAPAPPVPAAGESPEQPPLARAWAEQQTATAQATRADPTDRVMQSAGATRLRPYALDGPTPDRRQATAAPAPRAIPAPPADTAFAASSYRSSPPPSTVVDRARPGAAARAPEAVQSRPTRPSAPPGDQAFPDRSAKTATPGATDTTHRAKGLTVVLDPPATVRRRRPDHARSMAQVSRIESPPTVAPTLVRARPQTGIVSSDGPASLAAIPPDPAVVADGLATADPAPREGRVGEPTGARFDRIFHLPEVARGVIRQLANTATLNLAERPVELSLDPAELGRVRLTLAVSDAGVSVSIVAERPETLELMRRYAEALAAEYRSLGYAEVNLSFGAAADGPGSDSAPGHQNAPAEASAGSESAAASPDDAAPLKLRLSDSGRLDIRI